MLDKRTSVDHVDHLHEQEQNSRENERAFDVFVKTATYVPSF